MFWDKGGGKDGVGFEGRDQVTNIYMYIYFQHWPHQVTCACVVIMFEFAFFLGRCRFFELFDELFLLINIIIQMFFGGCRLRLSYR